MGRLSARVRRWGDWARYVRDDKACRRKAKCALSRARRECASAIERFDAFEAAMATLRGALECVDIHTGELHRPEHVEALVEQVAGRIELARRGASARSLRSTCAIARRVWCWRRRACCPGSRRWVSSGRCRRCAWGACAGTWSASCASTLPTRGAVRCLVISLGPMGRCKTNSAPRAHRCSMRWRRCCISAIVHRAPSRGSTRRCAPTSTSTRASPRGFLDLFRAWFNLRTRRWGRHKGTSAHESLTGQRVGDWLTLLGYPPSLALV